MATVDRTAGDAPSSTDKESSHDFWYEILCDIRDATTRSFDAYLSAAGFDDVTEDELLILATMYHTGAAARVLIRRLGITSQVTSQSIEKLMLRGYLELRDNPDDPRQPTVVFTERGRAAVEEAEACTVAARWAEFPFRSGDIVISTGAKSGTTWMQMICALLIFQSPEPPASLPELSPWIDRRAGGAEIYAQLAAQQHRRFIKTHTPLDKIPIDANVTYIVVARNPLDVAVSYHHQISNLLGRKGDHETPPESPRQWILDKIDEMGTSPQGIDEMGISPRGGDSYFDMLLKNLSVAWERRTEPNVVLVHYEDLSTDLAGEMRRLAGRLDITIPEAKWPSLVKAATFKHMRAAADQLQPLMSTTIRDVGNEYAAFFRRGSSGEGQNMLTNTEAARYYARAAHVAPRELLTWLHRGAVIRE